MLMTRDYETRSAVDINKYGASYYAQHPSTDAICMAVKFDDGPTHIWVNPRLVDKLPTDHGLPLIDGPDLVYQLTWGPETESHNDPFEYAIDLYVMHARYGWPMPPIDQRKCSAAQAALNALPRKLETLTHDVLFPPDEDETEEEAAEKKRKDKRGKELIQRLSVPQRMYARDWKRWEEKYGDYDLWCKAREAYKNALKDKGKRYAAFICDHWQQIMDDGHDPNDMLVWGDDPQDILDFCWYCIQDVESEYAASQTMPPFDAAELAVWRMDQYINQRGVHIDVAGARNAIRCTQEFVSLMEGELSTVTNGRVNTIGQHAALKDWCKLRGVDLPNTAKDTLQYYLRDVELPDDVRRALEIRTSAGQTSVTKYEAMLRAASNHDHRVRGWAVYCGAATGRWSAYLVQLHNMPRGTVKLKSDAGIDAAYAAMACGWKEVQALYGDVMGLISSAVRGCITAAPGYEFTVADFKSVEARGTVWEADETDALNIFRSGLCAYRKAASGIFGVNYDDIAPEGDDRRQVGKVGVLSLGYGGGIGAYASMARNYGIDLETLVPLVLPQATGYEIKKAESIANTYLENLERRIKLKTEKGIGKASPLERMSLQAAMSCDIIKQRWRLEHPKVVQAWADMEDAAQAAVRYPGQPYRAGRAVFKTEGDFLLMRLPSGRCLRYYKPEIKRRAKFGKPADVICFWRMKEGRWMFTDTYGGKLFENYVQAICRDLLVHGMFNVERAGYPVVIHVHDEAGSERPRGVGCLEEYCDLMAQAPAWADGLPMAANGWQGRRYRK